MSAIHEELLLSRIIETADLLPMFTAGVTAQHFTTKIGRDVFDFILGYAGAGSESRTPTYAEVLAKYPKFVYTQEAGDVFYLAGRVKEHAAMKQTQDYFGGREIADMFAKVGDGLTMAQFVDTLTGRLNDIKALSQVDKPNYIDVDKSAALFLEEFERRRSGESFKLWRSKFPSINDEIGGGFFGGNMYVVFAKSGRGKSIYTLAEAVEFAMQGARVLVWAMEIPWFEYLSRVYTEISARTGVMASVISNVDYSIGFDNRAMIAGQLDDEYMIKFTQFLAKINELIPGHIRVKASDTPGFTDRSLKALRADIEDHQSDVVIVDPFYYLAYERNTSNTTGGDAAATSQALRLMTGELGVATIAITQADEDGEEEADEVTKIRELSLPKRKDVKKTKQLLEDASLLIAVDSDAKQGRGLLGIKKGRTGGEGTEVEILYMPNYGLVAEPNRAAEYAKFGSDIP